MPSFEPGDQVLIDITDTTESEFQWHGAKATIVAVLDGDTGEDTVEKQNESRYRIHLDAYEQSLVLPDCNLRVPLDE